MLAVIESLPVLGQVGDLGLLVSAVPQWAASGTLLSATFCQDEVRSLRITPCCWEQSRAEVCGARPGWLAEPEGALPCPCADAGGLGLPSLKNKRVSKGDLSKEELTWPLTLGGAQEVSAHRAALRPCCPGALGCPRGAAGVRDPRLFPSCSPLLLGALGTLRCQLQCSFASIIFVFIFKFLIYVMSAAAGGCGA